MNALQSLQASVASLQSTATDIAVKLSAPPVVQGVAEADVLAQAVAVQGVVNVLQAALNPVAAPATASATA